MIATPATPRATDLIRHKPLFIKRATPDAKLDERDAAAIRELVEYREQLRAKASALSNRALADKFGVHRRTIERLIAGETWGHA